MQLNHTKEADMAQAAYRFDAYPMQQPERSARPDVCVVPGKRERSKTEAKPVTGSLVFRLVIGVMVVIALTCFATITLKTATSSVLGDTKSIESSMSTMKSDSTDARGCRIRRCRQHRGDQSPCRENRHVCAVRGSAPSFCRRTSFRLDARGALSLAGSIKNAAEISRVKP